MWSKLSLQAAIWLNFDLCMLWRPCASRAATEIQNVRSQWRDEGCWYLAFPNRHSHCGNTAPKFVVQIPFILLCHRQLQTCTKSCKCTIRICKVKYIQIISKLIWNQHECVLMMLLAHGCEGMSPVFLCQTDSLRSPAWSTFPCTCNLRRLQWPRTTLSNLRTQLHAACPSPSGSYVYSKITSAAIMCPQDQNVLLKTPNHNLKTEFQFHLASWPIITQMRNNNLTVKLIMTQVPSSFEWLCLSLVWTWLSLVLYTKR